MILTLIIISFAYFSIFGVKTDRFNKIINNKVKEYNPNLTLKLKDVFIRANIAQASITLNTKNAVLNSKTNPVKISNMDINLNIISFIKKKIQSKILKLNLQKIL